MGGTGGEAEEEVSCEASPACGSAVQLSAPVQREGHPQPCWGVKIAQQSAKLELHLRLRLPVGAGGGAL